MHGKVVVVGLTGGIASGKSTVAGFLREAGAPVMDADSLGHMVIEPDGEAYGQVIEAFGQDIVSDDGRVDRRRLGEKVFDNPEQRSRLESITHPFIAKLAKRGVEMIGERGERLAFYEAALLIETGIHESLDATVVVACRVATQMQRLVDRDGFTKEAAAARIASQYPLEEKLAVADYVIDTDVQLEETKSKTIDVLAALRTRFTDG